MVSRKNPQPSPFRPRNKKTSANKTHTVRYALFLKLTQTKSAQAGDFTAPPGLALALPLRLSCLPAPRPAMGSCRCCRLLWSGLWLAAAPQPHLHGRITRRGEVRYCRHCSWLGSPLWLAAAGLPRPCGLCGRPSEVRSIHSLPWLRGWPWI